MASSEHSNIQINVNVNNSQPVEHSTVAYVAFEDALPEPMPMAAIGSGSEYQDSWIQDDEIVLQKPDRRLALKLFLVGFTMPIIVYAFGVVFHSFHVALGSVITLLIVSIITVKFVDRGCLVIGCEATWHNS